jgi:lipopolysaccharide/colanic/teichoic acid biosynthesis glycosyltransferase
MRRVFDSTVALLGLLLLSPVLVLVALGVKVTSRGPVLYRPRRIGLKGKPFVLYKFRTMVHGAGGPAITSYRDPRVTRFGALLRRSKIDELPQLLNVVRGDMALVGPRPEDEAYIQYYSLDELHVLDARPGITSPVSLKFRDEEELLDGADWHSKYVNVILHEKLKGELEYLQRRTFYSDLGVLLRTIRA